MMSDGGSQYRSGLLVRIRQDLRRSQVRVGVPGLLAEGVLLCRGVGLGEPMQQIATTLGWLQRGGDAVGTARQSSSRRGTCICCARGGGGVRPVASYVVNERCCGAGLA